MGNILEKGVEYFKKDEPSVINASDITLSLPKGLKIRDQREIFMLKFPFYQMEVAHFRHVMEKLEDNMVTSEPELFEIFKDIDQINSNWLRVHTLLKADIFQLKRESQVHGIRTEKNKIDAISFALMGFLWCKGSK